MAVTEALTRPIGPLAAWQWGAVAIGGFIAYRFISGSGIGGGSSPTGTTVGATGSGDTGSNIVQGPQGDTGPAGATISGSGVTPADITDWLNSGVAPADIKTLITDLNPATPVAPAPKPAPEIKGTAVTLAGYNAALAAFNKKTPGVYNPGSYQNWLDSLGTSAGPKYNLYGLIKLPATVTVKPPSTTTGNQTPASHPDTTVHTTVKPVYYTIKKGDTLTKIAARYHTTVAHLLKLNPYIKNRNLIYTGRKVRVK
jgi:LysM repeat protein